MATTQDILGYLMDKYQTSQEDLTEENKTTLQGFVDFGREYLANNPPVTTHFADAGLSFRLQDGTDFVFTEYAGTEMGDAGMVVQLSTPVVQNIGMTTMTTDTTSVAVTGTGDPETDKASSGCCSS